MKFLESLFTPADNFGVRRLAGFWSVLKAGLAPLVQSFVTQVRVMRANGSLEKYVGMEEGNKIIECANILEHVMEMVRTGSTDGDNFNLEEIPEIEPPAAAPEETNTPPRNDGQGTQIPGNVEQGGTTLETVTHTHTPGEIVGASNEGSPLPASSPGEAASLIPETPAEAQAAVHVEPEPEPHQDEPEDTSSQGNSPRGRRSRRGNA